MKQEDYLMRMIEAFAQRLGQMIAQVLDLTEEGNYGHAHALLDQATRQLIDLSTDGLVRIQDDTLLETLKLDMRADWRERGSYLAFLLREDGRIHMMQNHEQQAIGRFVTALHLQLAIFPQPEQTVLQLEDIEDTLSELDEYELPGRTYAALVHHYEHIHAFGKAEDMLFDWMDAGSAAADLHEANPVEIGIAFYERLLLQSDTILAAGNLPRDEVKESLENLLADE